MKKQLVLVVGFALITMSLLAQKPQEREVKFKYSQLPLNPLEESVTTYKSEMVVDYKEEIESIISEAEAAHQKRIGRIPKDLDDAKEIYQIEMEMYEKELVISEEEYQRALDQHEKDKVSAEEMHAKKVEEWKGSSVINKMQNPKPVLRYPSRPYKRTPSRPQVKVPNEVPKFVMPIEAKAQTLYNESQYADSYLKIDGLKNGDGGLNIKGVVYKMEHMEIENKKDATGNMPGSGGSPTYSHWKEVKYKRPVWLTVTDNSGNIIFDGDVTSTTDYTLHVTERSKSTFSDQDLLDNLHDISMEASMNAALDMLNSKFGVSEKERETKLYLIKDKKGKYADYTQAFQTAMTGINSLTYDADAAMVSLKKASELWEAALAESDIMNKKARVDEKVTKATLYNLIEVNIWLGEYSKAEGYLNQLFSMKPTYIESIDFEERIQGYRDLILDQRDREKANS